MGQLQLQQVADQHIRGSDKFRRYPQAQRNGQVPLAVTEYSEQTKV